MAHWTDQVASWLISDADFRRGWLLQARVNGDGALAIEVERELAQSPPDEQRLQRILFRDCAPWLSQDGGVQ